MPAAYVQNQADEVNRQQTGDQLNNHVVAIHRHAHRADERRHESTMSSRSLSQLDHSHPQFINLSATREVVFYFFAAGLLCVYLVDLLIFGGAAHALARSSFPNNPVMAALLKFVIPVAFLGVELYLATQLYAAKYGAGKEAATPRHRRFYRFLAVIFAIVMPIFVIANHASTRKALESGQLAAISRVQVVALIIVAFVSHAIVIFGGRPAHESKSFILYDLRRRGWRRQIHRFNSEFELEALEATNQFNQYYQQLQDFNQQRPNRMIPPAEFDALTRALINERFGREVIQVANTPASGNDGSQSQPGGGQQAVATAASPKPLIPPPVSPPPPPFQPPVDHALTPAGADAATASAPASEGADGENEYLRQILQSRIRQADAEVQV
ncbi:MAG: hypothetical protein JST85_22480 [Acidobacteria bacterium]|nr:hypothetical protein [Acidobacteriota bacterium]